MQVMRIATDGFETDSDTKGGLSPAESSRHVIFRIAELSFWATNNQSKPGLY